MSNQNDGAADIVAHSTEDREEVDDEISVIDESDSEEDEEGQGEEETADIIASQSSRESIVERDDDDGDGGDFHMGAQSQDPRGFLERMFYNESDVRFVNETNREVLFVIADEEFTIKRTTKVSASASINEDEDDDDDGGSMNFNFGLNLIPLSAGAEASCTSTVSKHALRTRCMPVAPRSHSTQHFHSERLTYVTALTKDMDGECNPWTRVHYENKVISSRRTKSLRFCQKHLKVSAYRITKALPMKKGASLKRLTESKSPKQITESGEGSNSTSLVRFASVKKLKLK
mmetsp:Transcript_15422/g.44709  ORF Transcript_15422/g.44709 Transcript_15422/m.44709 type:complete len:289 (-) Transcript_15422:86-952(-)